MEKNCIRNTAFSDESKVNKRQPDEASTSGNSVLESQRQPSSLSYELR